MPAKERVTVLLRAADIEIDGSRPWDLQVHDERVYQRVLAEGTVGAGEAYMDGWWEVEQLDEFFVRVLQARLDRAFRSLSMLGQVILSRLGNLQNRRRSRRVA